MGQICRPDALLDERIVEPFALFMFPKCNNRSQFRVCRLLFFAFISDESLELLHTECSDDVCADPSNLLSDFLLFIFVSIIRSSSSSYFYFVLLLSLKVYRNKFCLAKKVLAESTGYISIGIEFFQDTMNRFLFNKR